MGLKGRERCQKINGFKHAGLALRVSSGQQNDPCWDIDIQPGKVSKVGKGEVF